MSNEVEDIKNRLNVVEIVNEYVKLTKTGSNYKAPCPFHQEKTPSFVVSEDKQIYHCFGCGKGGDMFTFIQEIEGCEFPEALRILAKKANVDLKPTNPELYSAKTKVLDALKLSAKFYNKAFLDSTEGELARDYLKERELISETIEDYQIGYAPDDWKKLYDFLKAKNFEDDVIFKTGMVVENATGANRYYDRFRRRLMFPIKDVHGQTVGFTGRLLPGADESKSGGKYVNTPQTIVYNKSYVLYNLDLAKQHIKKLDYTIIVEGQMDAVALYQAGIKNVVCSSGTALTEQQVKLLKRYSNNIILSFDQDQAGQDAMLRGVEQAMKEEMNIKVLTLPFGKDPDECVKKDKQAFLTAVKEAKFIMDHMYKVTFEKFDMSNVQDKKQAVKTILPWLTKLASEIEKSHYLQQLADKLGVKEDVLIEEFTRLDKKNTPLRSHKKDEPAKQEEGKSKSRLEEVTERVLGMLLYKDKDDLLKEIVTNTNPEDLLGELNQKLYKQMVIYYTEKQRFETENFILEYLKEDSILKKHAEVLALLGENEVNELEGDQILSEIIANLSLIKKSHLENRIGKIEDLLKQAEASKNQSQIDELTEEFTKLTQKLKSLQK